MIVVTLVFTNQFVNVCIFDATSSIVKVVCMLGIHLADVLRRYLTRQTNTADIHFTSWILHHHLIWSSHSADVTLTHSYALVCTLGNHVG